jgi:hypothetical protein
MKTEQTNLSELIASTREQIALRENLAAQNTGHASIQIGIDSLKRRLAQLEEEDASVSFEHRPRIKKKQATR